MHCDLLLKPPPSRALPAKTRLFGAARRHAATLPRTCAPHPRHSLPPRAQKRVSTPSLTPCGPGDAPQHLVQRSRLKQLLEQIPVSQPPSRPLRGDRSSRNPPQTPFKIPPPDAPRRRAADRVRREHPHREPHPGPRSTHAHSLLCAPRIEVTASTAHQNVENVAELMFNQARPLQYAEMLLLPRSRSLRSCPQLFQLHRLWRDIV